VLVLIGMNPLFGQEPDPYLLWQTTDPLGYSGFVIHPNGNIIANRGAEIFELDGNTGQVIKTFSVFLDNEINAMDVSKDGKLLGAGLGTIIFYDLENDTVIGSLVQNGNGRFAFFPDNKRFITTLGGYPDSNLAIYNFETKETIIFGSIIYAVFAVATSPDGKYFATGGTSIEKDIMGDDVFYTILTLWDAVTLNPIKELAKIGGNFEVKSIKFSPDGKYVGFQVGLSNLYFYKLEELSLYKYYDYAFVNLGIIGGFCFLGDDFIVVKSREPGLDKPIKLSFINTFYDKKIMSIINIGAGSKIVIDKNSINNTLVDAGGKISSYDLNKIITSVIEPKRKTDFSIQYTKGFILLSNLNTVSSQINITISDINGRVIHKLDSPVTNYELRIPLELLNGTYLLHIQDKDNEYSSKFLVTE